MADKGPDLEAVAEEKDGREKSLVFVVTRI